MDEISEQIQVIKAAVDQPDRSDPRLITAVTQAVRVLIDAILRLPAPPTKNAKNRPF